MEKTKKTGLITLGLTLTLSLLFTGCSSTAKQPPTKATATASTKVTVEVKKPEPARTLPEIKKNTPPAVKPTPPVVKETPKPVVTMRAATGDARDLLQEAVASTAKAKSFNSEMIMNVELMQMKMAFTFDLKKYEDSFYMTGDIMGMNMQSYSVGNVSVFKDPATQRWEVAKSEQENLKSIFEKMTGLVYLNSVKDAKVTGDIQINGIDCNVIEATMDPDSINNIISKESVPLMEMGAIGFEKVTLKICVGRDDHLFYKVVIVMEAKMNMEMLGLPQREGDEKENEEDIEDEDAAELTPKPMPDKEPVKTKTEDSKATYSIEMNYRDYDKVEPIVIPPEIKALMEGKVEETTPPPAPKQPEPSEAK